MKGTFSRYDPETGKGLIKPDPDHHTQSISFGAAAGALLAAREYTFSIPLAEAARAKINVGGSVEFDKLTTAGVEATNLRY